MTIKNILQKTGPILSGDLKERLIKTHNLKPDAARKRISRLNDVHKIKGFFADNQTFISLFEDLETERYYNNLRGALKAKAKRLFSILTALEFHNGSLKENELANYGFSPIKNLKGHKRFDTIITHLLKEKWISKEENLFTINELIAFRLSENDKHRQAVETVKNILLLQFNDWARKTGLASYDKGKYNSELGKFQWAYTAPCYISSLRKYRAGKKMMPGFVVCDILIGNKITTEHVSFFTEKVEAFQSVKNNPNIFPVLLVDGIEKAALDLLKTKGVMIAFIDRMFGEEYVELIRSLINLVTNSEAILKTKPEQFLSLMSNIEKLVGGKTNNLRGDLFELAVGYYHSQSCNSLDIGKKIIHEENRREMDVLARYSKEVIIAECKGYNYPIKKNMVEEWLGEKVPIIRKWLLSHNDYGDWEMTFEIWATGGFTDDARELLTERAKNTKKYKIKFYSKKEILEKAKELSSSKFTEIMKDYFVKEKV